MESRHLKIVDQRIQGFYAQNTNLLLLKHKSSFRHLQRGIQEFHRKCVLVPADKAANNTVVVLRLYYTQSCLLLGRSGSNLPQCFSGVADAPGISWCLNAL